jgi:hypothetical protein
MNQIKQALKSKTVWLGIALAVVSLLQGYVGYLPTPAIQATVGSVFAALIVILRALTTMPLGDK